MSATPLTAAQIAAQRRRRRRALAWGAAFALLVPAVIAVAIPARVRIPRTPDHRPFAPAARAVFSHRSHEPLRCFQCHPSVFPQGQLAFDHAAMDRGRFCGACHDGRRAPAVARYTCEGCHAPEN